MLSAAVNNGGAMAQAAKRSRIIGVNIGDQSFKKASNTVSGYLLPMLLPLLLIPTVHNYYEKNRTLQKNVVYCFFGL